MMSEPVAFNLPVDHGAMVQQVTKGSPADKAGLRAGHIQTSQGIVAGGDVIVGVAGKAVNKAADIASAISDKKPGDQVPIAFYRGKTKKLVTLTLGNRPAKAPSTQQDQGGGGGGGLFPLP